VSDYNHSVIFRKIGDMRPYPDHVLRQVDWTRISPTEVRLDRLITTNTTLDLHRLLAEDSTFHDDMFPHVVDWNGDLYLENGLHRALRAALDQRSAVHARVVSLFGPKR
jgi:Arc/MetJ family transcription regulator